jgi:hypothetical protein
LQRKSKNHVHSNTKIINTKSDTNWKLKITAKITVRREREKYNNAGVQSFSNVLAIYIL